MGDPFLDDPLPREYVLYLRPTGPLAQKLSDFWQQSKQICGKNKAHNIFPHITLCQFFMVSYYPLSPDLGSLMPYIPNLHPGRRSQSLKACQESGRNSHGLLELDGPSRSQWGPWLLTQHLFLISAKAQAHARFGVASWWQRAPQNPSDKPDPLNDMLVWQPQQEWFH